MTVYVGMGGWTYEPWRETFYPEDLTHARELEYASRQVTAIEVNGTFYRTQTPSTFAKWRDATPDGFVFTLKAPRYTSQRRVLAEAGEGIQRFVTSGITELGAKLGAILWSFAPTKRFDAQDFEAFLKMLPRETKRGPLRHALDVRHETFMTAEFVDLARAYGAAIVYSDTEGFPSCADITADFVYARLKRCESAVKTGYRKPALEQWAKRVALWAKGGEPEDLPRAGIDRAKKAQRDVFVFFISGAKERAPEAARTLIRLLG
jgi:uncharacterized protein YecE (DUF72 family)